MVVRLELSAGAPGIVRMKFIKQTLLQMFARERKFYTQCFLLSTNLRSFGLNDFNFKILDSRGFIDKFLLSDWLQKQSGDSREIYILVQRGRKL